MLVTTPLRGKLGTRLRRLTGARRESGTPALRRGIRHVFGIKTTVVHFDSSVYFVPGYAAHRPVAVNILNKRHEAPELHRLVGRVMTRRPGSMISAGTFFGDMLPSFSGKTPGLLYAFEPVIENYLLARAVVAANDLRNVVLLHAGLGAEPGLANIATGRRGKRHRGGACRIISESDDSEFRTQRVPMLSIDQLAIGDLSMIQLDVESYELPVLRGATGAIRAQQPVIVIEDDLQNCSEFLAELSYVEVAKIGRDHVYLPQAIASDANDLFLPEGP
jgi:FkbM family methyltransferase